MSDSFSVAVGHSTISSPIENRASPGIIFRVGKSSVISPGVIFEETDEHRPRKYRRNSHLIEIGNDVYIHRNVTLTPGITIGDGAIIGRDSIVTRDVPPYAIIKEGELVGFRYQPDTIAFLLELKWWDWSEAQRRNNKWFFKESLYRTSEISISIDSTKLDQIAERLVL